MGSMSCPSGGLTDGYCKKKSSAGWKMRDNMPGKKADDQMSETWSLQQGLPSSPRSAKYSDCRNNSSDELVISSSSNSKAPPPNNFFRRGVFSGNMTADTTATDDEFVPNWASTASSTNSSISWAEDAVEAEMTKKIFLLWEDVQRVCTGEVEERPEDMAETVYEECLNWKRAFPDHNLSRFSRFIDNDSTPTPTPKAEEVNDPFFLSPPLYSSRSPDLQNTYCLTPIMEHHSNVDLWLSDCHGGTAYDGDPYNDRIPFLSHALIRPPHTSSLARNRNIHTPGIPDTTSFFPSIPLDSFADSVSGYNSLGTGDIRVQRPVSSITRGHLITPLRTREHKGPRNSAKLSSNGRNGSSQHSRAPNRELLPVNREQEASANHNVNREGRENDHVSGRSSHRHPPLLSWHDKLNCGSAPASQHTNLQFYGNTTKTTTTTYSNNSSGNVIFSEERRYVDANGTISRLSSGSASHRAPNWSRHSSITEAHNFEVTRNGTFTSNATIIEDKVFDDAMVTADFQAPSAQSNNVTKLRRPDFLATTIREQDLSPSDLEERQESEAKPVRPFLHWLLDKVSPS